LESVKSGPKRSQSKTKHTQIGVASASFEQRLADNLETEEAKTERNNELKGDIS